MMVVLVPASSFHTHAHTLQAGVPMLVMLATGTDDLRMPSTGMWEIMCRDHNGGVHPGEADGGGRGGDAGRGRA